MRINGARRLAVAAALLALTACTASVVGSARPAKVPTMTGPSPTASGPTGSITGEIVAPPPSSSANDPDKVYARVDASGAIVVVKGKPGISIEFYEEPICPPCAVISHRDGDDLHTAVSDGRLELRIRVLTFLDDKSASGDYSTRAFAAMLTAASSEDGEALLTFQQAVFDSVNQPEEGGADDLTNDQLADLAQRAGVADPFVKAIRSGSAIGTAEQAAKSNQRALTDLAGTIAVPAAAVDGKQVNVNRDDWLAAAIG